MNEDLHKQWEEKEQFPPYDFSLDLGKEMFSKPFKNGKSYADCFPNQGVGIRQNYPYFDEKEGKVVTLELALNRCREANGEAPFSYVKDEYGGADRLHGLHVARQACRSTSTSPTIRARWKPTRKRQALFSTTKRQPTLSCASCHVQNPGERICAEILAPALDLQCDADLPFRMGRHAGTISRRFTTLATARSARRAARSPPPQIRRVPRSRIRFVLRCQQRTADLRPGRTAMRHKMRISTLSIASALLLIAGATSVLAAAASEVDFKAAYAAAEAANKEAGSLRNQWTTTAATLADAKKAADKGDFDAATASAKEAEALAKASIYQATMAEAIESAFRN